MTGILRRFLLAAAVAYGSSCCAAPAGDTYGGTVAGQPVLVHFLTHDLALFFYRNHAKVLELNPIAGQPGLWAECLPERAGECDSPSGVWELSVAAGGARGVWRRTVGASESKPIRLTAQKQRGSDPEHAFWTMRDEDEARIVTQRAARYGVAWRTVRLSAKGTPRKYDGYEATVQLVEAPDAAAMTRINRSLMPVPPGRTRPSKEVDEASVLDEAITDVIFANANFLGVRTRTNWHGGAHPSNGFSTTTYDLRTGRPVDWGEILRLSPDEGTALDLRRRDVLAAHVLRAALDGSWCFSEALESYGCTAASCAHPPTGERMYWSLWPTPEGLAVAPNVHSEATRGCRGEHLVVPLALVKETMRRHVQLP